MKQKLFLFVLLSLPAQLYVAAGGNGFEDWEMVEGDSDEEGLDDFVAVGMPTDMVETGTAPETLRLVERMHAELKMIEQLEMQKLLELRERIREILLQELNRDHRREVSLAHTAVNAHVKLKQQAVTPQPVSHGSAGAPPPPPPPPLPDLIKDQIALTGAAAVSSVAHHKTPLSHPSVRKVHKQGPAQGGRVDMDAVLKMHAKLKKQREAREREAAAAAKPTREKPPVPKKPVGKK